MLQENAYVIYRQPPESLWISIESYCLASARIQKYTHQVNLCHVMSHVTLIINVQRSRLRLKSVDQANAGRRRRRRRRRYRTPPPSTTRPYSVLSWLIQQPRRQLLIIQLTFPASIASVIHPHHACGNLLNNSPHYRRLHHEVSSSPCPQIYVDSPLVSHCLVPPRCLRWIPLKLGQSANAFSAQMKTPMLKDEA